MRELYTAKELADLLSMHPETIRKLGREGKIDRVKVGKSVRFLMPRKERSSVEREIKKQRSLCG